MKSMTVPVEELRQVINTIFDHMQRDLKIDQIELKNDYYWDVPAPELFEVLESPPQLGMGQLYEDWEFLKPLLNDNDQAVSMMFIHVAPLLRYIGEIIGQ